MTKQEWIEAISATKWALVAFSVWFFLFVICIVWMGFQVKRYDVHMAIEQNQRDIDKNETAIKKLMTHTHERHQNDKVIFY